MGPTKAIMKGDALYDARTGKLLQAGLANPKARQDYAKHHYVVLPEVDNAGVYCIRGSRYETLDDHQPHLARCMDCGGMGIRVEEVTMERDCLRCTQCGHEFDARLEMMES